MTKKEVAIRIINDLINEVKNAEAGMQMDVVHMYDGAVNMAMMTGIITIAERKQFDHMMNDILN